MGWRRRRLRGIFARMPRQRKSPREKKRESYERDCRNVRGEHGSHSRHAVARARRNRASRARAASHALEALALRDPEAVERMEGQAALRFGGRWRKVADEPLGTVLPRQLERRRRMGILPDAVAEAKVAQVRRVG